MWSKVYLQQASMHILNRLLQPMIGLTSAVVTSTPILSKQGETIIMTWVQNYWVTRKMACERQRDISRQHTLRS